jgi:hypothetical protein
LGNLSNYFLHGILFSVILLVFWVYIGFVVAAILIFGLSFVGLMIAFVFLFFVMGGLNALLYNFVWNVSIQLDLISLLGHGFLLFVSLVAAHSPVFVLSLVWQPMVPSILIIITTFVPYCFISGFVAKKVGERWEE